MSTTAATSAVTLVATELKQWRIGVDRPGNVLPKRRFEDYPDRSYNLKGLKPRKFLQYEEQQFGINLGWTDDAEPATARRVARWFLARPGTANGPLLYGEPVALANGKDPSFLRYKTRQFGINLDWSHDPVFEWKVAGGKAGQPVHTADNVAIYNSRVDVEGGHGDFFVHFQRQIGANIGWTTSPSWFDQLEQELKKLLPEGIDRAIRAAVLAAFGL
ncbi:hypothetical protein ACQP2F_36155 [Actinoplanes sp. CA-030573]|uniref:hypothetical protein n=1 Tax=Actinoplanes sp. CA-030573 TaxID=3239898 RepID=UPI003D8D895A